MIILIYQELLALAADMRELERRDEERQREAGNVCCSVLQCVAVCCRVLQCVAVRNRVGRDSVRLSTCVALCCTVLQ